jgi:hypothetical protein
MRLHRPLRRVPECVLLGLFSAKEALLRREREAIIPLFAIDAFRGIA